VTQQSPAADPLDTVEVRVPATPSHLSSVRAVAADLAMRQDFDLDSISDLRMAVDEVCSALIRIALPGSVLSCRFVIEPGQIKVLGRAYTAEGAELNEDSFGWWVLRSLADDVTVTVTDVAEPTSDGAGPVLDVELLKRSVVVVEE
jgi:serine/threonine-protein kinase RsbW